MRALRTFLIALSLVAVSSQAEAINWAAVVKALTGKAAKSAPKQADELPPVMRRPKSTDQGLGLDLPLITRSLARASHYRTCPAIRLRVSLPLLNVRIDVPSKLNIRVGPGTNYQRQAAFIKAGPYIVDLLDTNKCWLQVRYPVGGSQNAKGWVSSKYLSFEFDNHFTKPQKRLTRNLGADGVYKLVARSTYKVRSPSGQGTAVAISPTVLLTNCHVLGKYAAVHILENGQGYQAVLIHHDKSKDKCFIRSLTLKVRPVPNVQDFSNIRNGIRAYTIGAPLGYNRSIGEGVVFARRRENGVRYIDATAPVEPGSSGGGLFDANGNLLGITTFKITTSRGQSYSASIVADDFWQ